MEDAIYPLGDIQHSVSRLYTRNREGLMDTWYNLGIKYLLHLQVGQFPEIANDPEVQIWRPYKSYLYKFLVEMRKNEYGDVELKDVCYKAGFDFSDLGNFGVNPHFLSSNKFLNSTLNVLEKWTYGEKVDKSMVLWEEQLTPPEGYIEKRIEMHLMRLKPVRKQVEESPFVFEEILHSAMRRPTRVVRQRPNPEPATPTEAEIEAARRLFETVEEASAWQPSNRIAASTAATSFRPWQMNYTFDIPAPSPEPPVPTPSPIIVEGPEPEDLNLDDLDWEPSDEDDSDHPF